MNKWMRSLCSKRKFPPCIEKCAKYSLKHIPAVCSIYQTHMCAVPRLCFYCHILCMISNTASQFFRLCQVWVSQSPLGVMSVFVRWSSGSTSEETMAAVKRCVTSCLSPLCLSRRPVVFGAFLVGRLWIIPPRLVHISTHKHGDPVNGLQ